MKQLKINNSKKAAIKLGKKWKDPGAKLYDELLDAFYYEGGVPDGGKEFEDAIKSGKCTQWYDYLKEAYLVAPVDQIKNSPYGRTPFSRSGCKYSHHVIKNGELVVSIPGLRAAYICARNQGVFVNHTSENKKIVAHFNIHFKELGIEPLWHHGELYFKEEAESWKKIEENFDGINQFIFKNMGIDLFDPEELSLFDEAKSNDPLENMIKANDEVGFDIDKSIREAANWIDKFVNDDEFRESVPTSYLDQFKKIKTPEELLKWMDFIQYGWIDNGGKIQGTGDKDDEQDFYDQYQLQSPLQLMRSRVGICWDQTELERLWFSKHYYDFKIFYIEIDDGKSNPTHTFCVYQNEEGCYWFEHSWYDFRGIHEYMTLKECLDDIIAKHQASSNDTTSPIILTVMTTAPKTGCSCEEFMNHARTSQKVDIYDVASDLLESAFTEAIISPKFLEELAEDIDEDDEVEILRVNELLAKGYTPAEIEALKFIKESDENLIDDKDPEKKELKEEFVPIYGIVKCYSTSKLRNDGTEKSQSELNSVRFHKIIERLTRGDKYSHALVSFDDSLTKMYSYEDEGFEIDNILTKDSWMGTESIYICVMFVSKSDKARMQKFIKDLAINANRSRYASANLLKAYVATPYKVDKRFVCSSFTGYIMSCANPKNLHRDYSRCRPEDITILPRAFYLMNAHDRDDFMKHRDEIRKKVNSIYEEFHEEIEDYNNHLPKLMIKDRVDKLKTIDKIFDWIIDRM